MGQYTIKTTDEAQLFLQNEKGQAVPAIEILRAHPQARVFAFQGQMGAGKTTFIKQLCQELKTDDVVNSPTFAIVNVYEISHGQGRTAEEIYHFDCYRLKDIREAVDFGAEDYLYSGNYCFIEWPDIIVPLLPDDTIWLQIDVKEDGTRILSEIQDMTYPK